MYYKQLKDFFRQREQKAFWIFNYANIAGLFGGLFAARFLTEQLPWLPGPLLIPLVMFGGLSLTWQRQGRETYRTWWLWSMYLLQRLFASQSLMLHSAEHYRIEHTGMRPFSVAGRLAYSGEDIARAYGRTLPRSSAARAATGGGSNGASPGATLPISPQATSDSDTLDIEEG